jgi:PAS domain S-box-containing protein
MRRRGALLLYVGAVTAAAVAGSVVAVRVDAHHGLPVVVLPMLVALICAAESLQLRYHHLDDVDALTLVEAALAPTLVACSGLEVVAVVAVAMAGAAAVRRNTPVKTLFNVAEWVLAAVAGVLVLHLLDAVFPALLALAVALVFVSVVNQLTFAGLMVLVTGDPLGAADPSLRRFIAVGRLAGLATNLTFGLLLAIAVRVVPAAVLLAFPLFALLHAAGRSVAGLRADRLRLAGLRGAASALGGAVDPEAALPVFLAEVRSAFEVRAVHLALREGQGWVVRRLVGDDPTTSYTVHTDPGDAAVLGLLATIPGPVRVTARSGDERVRHLVAALGHRSCLAVPVHGTTASGVLCLYDRIGMEGFEDGEPAVAAALATDVAEFIERAALYVRLADERRKLADIVGNSSDGILTVDSTGMVHSWNASLETITGHAAHRMVGARTLGRLVPRDADGTRVCLDGWASGETLPAQLEIRTAEGRERWLECSYGRAPGTDDSGLLVVVARDVTQARELDRLKDDFLAIVSHELRTPLVPIKGWTKTMLQRGEALTAAQREDGLRAILGQAQRLEQLVLNILEASRADTADPISDPVDVVATIRSVVADVVTAGPGRVIELVHADTPVTVVSRQVWLERILANLIGNAVKYSPSHEPVTVRVDAAPGSVQISVTDAGDGIPLAEQARIFERFERLADTATQTGTGLGLYIARRLALALGGDVTVTSAPGRGATFTLRLPAPGVPSPRKAIGPARQTVSSHSG